MNEINLPVATVCASVIAIIVLAIGIAVAIDVVRTAIILQDSLFLRGRNIFQLLDDFFTESRQGLRLALKVGLKEFQGKFSSVS